ncbi:hypothetical protein LWP59_24865 [Amycolatopsis acidiphila]|nr:hypothetical protein [Amycolatopsis acidiphila]UIJ57376.1 hypothetical protein LWP59_24865 [Amycolatopsis acidiphila]GHG84546.1 hypothetical protein GCM10017788_56660 [Amycolatopsis acidiphila]
MPRPLANRDDTPRPPAPPPPPVQERETALALPDWDLLPPAEFLVRRRRR